MRESGGRFGKMGAVVAELVGMGGRGTLLCPLGPGPLPPEHSFISWKRVLET